jgi:hypothetical protein
MTEQGFANCLQAILDGAIDGAASAVNEAFDPDGIQGVATYRDAGVMTMNNGLVVTMDDGTEFQLTVVRSR